MNSRKVIKQAVNAAAKQANSAIDNQYKSSVQNIKDRKNLAIQKIKEAYKEALRIVREEAKQAVIDARTEKHISKSHVKHLKGCLCEQEINQYMDNMQVRTPYVQAMANIVDRAIGNMRSGIIVTGVADSVKTFDEEVLGIKRQPKPVKQVKPVEQPIISSQVVNTEPEDDYDSDDDWDTDYMFTDQDLRLKFIRSDPRKVDQLSCSEFIESIEGMEWSEVSCIHRYRSLGFNLDMLDDMSENEMDNIFDIVESPIPPNMSTLKEFGWESTDLPFRRFANLRLN